MAIRVQTYDSGPRRIQAGPIDPGAPRGAIRDVRGTAQDSLLADVLAAGKQLTGIAIQEYVKDETTRVSQSLLGMQQELNAERDRYMAENKGQDAIGAGQHFEQFARAAVQRRLQDDKFSGRFAEMFMKQASGAALHFTEQGQAYGRQQKSAWEESVLQGDMEEFRKLVAQNYDNQELIEFNRDALRQRIEGMRPGMDNRALFSRLDSQTAGSIIEGYLAHDNISGARGALDKYRDLLGGEVNRVEASIASHARALESRARAEAERARAEAVTNRVGQWIAETKGLAPEERTAELYSRLDGIADMKERAQMAGLVNSELAFEKRRDDAKTAAAVSQFAATVKAENLSPLEAQARLAASDIPEEHQGYAMQKAYGEVQENAANRAALDEIRKRIDRKEITDKEQIERAGYNARMTDAQIKEAGKYLEQGRGRTCSRRWASARKLPDRRRKPGWIWRSNSPPCMPVWMMKVWRSWHRCCGRRLMLPMRRKRNVRTMPPGCRPWSRMHGSVVAGPRPCGRKNSVWCGRWRHWWARRPQRPTAS